MDPNQLAIATYDKIAEKYSQQYFDDLTETSYIDKFLKSIPAGGKILDVGCGPGQFTGYMMRAGFDVTGIDFSSAMIATAQHKVPEGTFLPMDMRALEFEDESFDGILVAYSLIHIASEDIPKTLEGFYRVLKPHGSIEIIAQAGKPDQIIDEPFLPSEKMFFNFFSTGRLSRFLKNAHFEVQFQLEAASLDPDSVSDRVIYTIAKKSY
jgi:ubiquinone/menaquinone biosynthesis C-methylase UbiE